jgi:hypothetical protein
MGGGGHFTMAAAIFPGQTTDRVVNTLTTTLDEYLDSAQELMVNSLAEEENMKVILLTTSKE